MGPSSAASAPSPEGRGVWKGRRVALVSRDVAGVGGTVTTVLEHARRLAALGCAVDVYGERLDAQAIAAAGARPRRVWNWPWGSLLKRRLFAALAGRALEQGRYDLVHGHGDLLAQDVLSLHNCVHAAHEAIRGKPLPPGAGVGVIHEAQLRGRLFRSLIANSSLMKDEVVSRFGVPADLVAVIHPGHDPARFNAAGRQSHRAAMRDLLRLTDIDVVFGLITSGDFEKRGVGVFIEALGLAAPRLGRGLKAIVMGKDRDLGPWRRQVVLEGLTGVVTFLPASTKVERFYHALDVYVHPAHYEEFGQSVQEALACGLPVLTNERVGASELLRGEARDYLLERTGRDGLAGHISVLFGDADLRRRLAALGPAAAAANTWDANFAATLAVYERLLAQKR